MSESPLPTDSRATPLAAVNIAAVSLAAVVTALRCFVRIRLLKAFGVDDYLMVAAMVCFGEQKRVPLVDTY
jgi:hypothetical protein